MKPKETSWNSQHHNGNASLHPTGYMYAVKQDDMGDAHVATSLETPLRQDAFELDDDSKMELDRAPFQKYYACFGARSQR